MTDPEPQTRFFHQPKAVWATAFACVVGFMSIGLVDRSEGDSEPGFALIHQLLSRHIRDDDGDRLCL